MVSEKKRPAGLARGKPYDDRTKIESLLRNLSAYLGKSLFSNATNTLTGLVSL